MAPPPDPRDASSRCSELSHLEAFEQFRTWSGALVIRNKFTGEEKEFPVGTAVALHFGGAMRRAFLVVDGEPTRWANLVFEKSAWRTSHGEVFHFRRVGDGFETQWSRDLLHSARNVTVSWPDADAGEEGKREMIVSVFKVARPTTERRMFWSLATLGKVLGKKGDAQRHFIQRWPLRLNEELSRDMGLNSADALGCFKQSTSSDSFDFATISTRAMLYVFAKAAGNQPTRAQAQASLLTLERFAEKWLPPASEAQITFPCLGDVGDLGMQMRLLEMVDHKLDVRALSKATWKLMPAVAQRAMRKIPKGPRHVADVIARLAPVSQLGWFLGQILRSLAQAVELWRVRDVSVAVPSAVELVQALDKSSKKRQRAAPPSRARFREPKTIKSELQRKVDEMGAWRKQDRYRRAAKQAIENCAQVSICPDASRIGKKDRLFGPVTNLCSQMSAWGPPQVPF